MKPLVLNGIRYALRRKRAMNASELTQRRLLRDFAARQDWNNNRRKAAKALLEGREPSDLKEFILREMLGGPDTRRHDFLAGYWLRMLAPA